MARKRPIDLAENPTITSNARIVIDSGTQSFKISAPNLAQGLTPFSAPPLVTTQDDDYSPTVVQDGSVIPLDSSAGPFEILLPNPATMEGRAFSFKDVSGSLKSNPVLVRPDANETIDGKFPNFPLTTPFGGWVIFSDGTNWHVIAAGSDRAEKKAAIAQKALAMRSVRTLKFQSAFSASEWESIVWAPEIGVFAAVASSGTTRYMFSTSGGAWLSEPGLEANEWRSLCWSGDLGAFVGVASSGTNRVSKNGSPFPAAEANQWYSVCWSPELGIFVAVSIDGTNRVMTSSNAESWTARTAGAANEWRSVCWSPELGIFVAVSEDGTNRAMTSSDGVNWAPHAIPGSNGWTSVCWSPELGIFVAVAKNGTDRVAVSSDGENWGLKEDVSGVSDWVSVAWSAQLGIFLAVATSSEAMFSEDGSIWKPCEVPESVSLRAICWSPETGMFVGVAGSGTNRVIRSL